VAANDSNTSPERGRTIPWWVRAAFMMGLGARRQVVRNFRYSAVGGIFIALFVAAPAFFLVTAFKPYRWWLLVYVGVAGLVLVWEWRAIRWLDRAKCWPEDEAP
jgi:hypothetical protein